MSQPPSRGRLAPRGGRRPATAAAAEAPASESSATPAATPASGSAAASTSTSSAATPASSSAAKPGLKFKPKAVRRGEAERQRIAEEQQRLQDIRNEQESRRLARANRGRGRGGGRGRGRGNFLMRGGRTASAAGPLSGGMGYGGGSSGDGGADGFGTSNGFDANRINADMLYTLSLEDEEEKLENGLVRTKKKRAPMPMGIRRFEHEEEEVVMATAAEIEAQDAGVDVAAGDNDDDDSSDLFVDNGEGPVQIKDEGAVDNTVPKAVIKKEGGEMEDVSMENIPEGVVKAPESPELKKKVMATTKDAEKPKEKKPKKPKETEADFAQQDRERLVELFNHGTELEGHMFLFQLPVVLPPLKSAAPAPKVKPEPEGDDVVMLDQPAASKSSSRIDLTLEEASKVKKENGEEADADAEQDMTREGGYVGQLVVRKSGKVEVSWGGVPLQMGLGIQANFLSTAAIIKEDDVKPAQDQYTGAAYGMGRIQGSFVLAHTFGDEEEWVVDPNELVIADEEQ
ncbi:RNA polymerase III RPC4-domain-containing protein [Copromyces sp. CBS 386.78]|nr:RNA polymerase III RPC4-domain-containing protein [Copromyces sp. CBS 386.78]